MPLELGEHFSCKVEHDTKTAVSVSLADILRPPGRRRRTPQRIVGIPSSGVATVMVEGKPQPALLIVDAFIRRLRVSATGNSRVLRPTISVTSFPNNGRTRELWEQMQNGWYTSSDGKVAEERRSPHGVLQGLFDDICCAPDQNLVLGGRVQFAYYWAMHFGQWKAYTALRSGMRLGVDEEPKRLLRRLERERKEDMRLALQTWRLQRYVQLFFNPPRMPDRIPASEDSWTKGHMPHSLLLSQLDRCLVPDLLAPIWAQYYMGDPKFAAQLRKQGIDLPDPIINGRAKGVHVHLPATSIKTEHFEGLNQHHVVFHDDDDEDEYE